MSDPVSLTMPLDERGVLLVERQYCSAITALLQHYRRFLESALPRCFGSP